VVIDNDSNISTSTTGGGLKLKLYFTSSPALISHSDSLAEGVNWNSNRQLEAG